MMCYSLNKLLYYCKQNWMASIKMFLNLSACEEENTFLPSLKQVLISTTLLHSTTVVCKHGDSPGYLTEKIETENQITTKISVPPHVILALV